MKGPLVLVPVISGIGIALEGVLTGAWWLAFPAGFLIGVMVARARVAIPAGAFAGLIGWSVPLVSIQIREGIGPTASSLAAIMGFTGQPAIPLILTCLVGLLLGVTGAWVGSALRGLVLHGTT
jgi:hypothetical protein